MPESRRLDAFDVLVLLTLAALSLAFLFWVVVRGGVFGGWEGFVVADQGQYLVWIREAADHVLIGNRFDMLPDHDVYLHPTLLISGVLSAAGLSEPVAYLLWKPVSVVVLFWGTRAYVRRHLVGTWERRAALVVALFFVPPLAVLSPLWGEAGRGTFDFISGEIWPVGHLWGYPMSAISVGLTPLVFLWAERAVAGSAPRRAALVMGGSAMLVSALHPWQGATLVVVLAAAIGWQARSARTPALTALRAVWPVLAAPLLPAAYYFVLQHTDASWELGAENYSTPLEFTMSWRLGLAFAPLALPALLAYAGRRPADLGERILWLWAPFAVALYLFPGTPVRFHAFNGVSIPLAILAVRGLAPYVARYAARGSTARVVTAGAVVAAIALLVLPGTVDRVRSARGAVYLNQQPYNLEAGEDDALDALAGADGPGGVMAPVDFAALVPYRTGRETWVATPSWSPDFGARAAAVSNLFAGRLPPAQARALVESSGVRFVVADCRTTTDLSAVLGPLVDVRRYGCATVYEVTSRRAASAPAST